MDVFTGQMTAVVLNAYEEANILIINIPANVTKYYQPLDLTANGYAKRFLKSKFTEWYSSQVRGYLDNGVSIDDIEVGLETSKIKPIHADWLVKFSNHMTTSKGKEIIDSGWRAACISDAIKLGSSKLPPINPFHDIDPRLGDESESSNRHLLALCDVTTNEFELLCGKKLGPENDGAVTDDETDSEWEEAELQDFMPRLYLCLIKKEKRKKKNCCHSRKFFSLQMKCFFIFTKVLYGEFVPKITIRENFAIF